MNLKQQKKVDILLEKFDKTGKINAEHVNDLNIFEATVEQYRIKKKKNVSVVVGYIEELQIVLKYYKSFHTLTVQLDHNHINEHDRIIKLLQTCNRIKNLRIFCRGYTGGSLSFVGIKVTHTFEVFYVSHKSDIHHIDMPKVKKIILGGTIADKPIYLDQRTDSVVFEKGYHKETNSSVFEKIHSRVDINIHAITIPLLFKCNKSESYLEDIVFAYSKLTDIPYWITQLPRLKLLRIGNRDFPLSKVASIRETLPHCEIQFD